MADFSFNIPSDTESETSNAGGGSDTEEEMSVDEDCPQRIVASVVSLKKKRSAWSRDRNAQRRIAGKSYIGKTDNGHVSVHRPAKCVGSGCGDKSRCRKSNTLKCAEFSNATRTKLLQHYLGLSVTARQTYLATLINNTSRSDVIKGTVPDQRTYYLPMRKTKLIVCAKMFQDTFCVSKASISDMFQGKKKDPLSRPVHVKPRDAKDVALDAFFAGIPLMASHYNRKDSSKLYIQRDITTLAQVYERYVETENAEGRDVFKSSKFNESFHQKNLALYVPLKDRCFVCQANEQEPRPEFEKHRKEVKDQKKYVDAIKKRAKEGKCSLLQMDAQANQLLPKSDSKAAVFKLKMNVHNNTFLNLVTGDCSCFLFDETAANLKASTHITTLVNFILLEAHKNPSSNSVYILSDTCAAANRNVYMGSALHELAMEMGCDIEQVYYISGHSFMEIDAVHSLIERKVKKPEIFCMDDYVSLMEKARPSNPITVYDCPHSTFKDFTTTKFASIRPKNFNVANIKSIRYSKDGIVKCRVSYAKEADWIELYRAENEEDFKSTERPQAFSGRLPIGAKKFKDLISMLEIIPTEHRAYYLNLPHI